MALGYDVKTLYVGDLKNVRHFIDVLELRDVSHLLRVIYIYHFSTSVEQRPRVLLSYLSFMTSAEGKMLEKASTII